MYDITDQTAIIKVLNADKSTAVSIAKVNPDMSNVILKMAFKGHLDIWTKLEIYPCEHESRNVDSTLI